ncbi:DUF2785 domain-containing protein [Sulfobacillus thermosulfidooxidans]|uniref:DUF2785 domain-containing protein n=1 Tax=Sulfobacillus thermosulfidooxidans TaxID=28034 RepID=UPI0006B57FE9|nr:DUF2785 domain-containing protein [Sulfobacillus thermosulfidooxidans]
MHWPVHDKTWLAQQLQRPQDWSRYPLLELLCQLLENLRSSDPVLRDQLSYTWIEQLFTSSALSPEIVDQFIERVLNKEHLFYRIGEKDTDSVFMRAFAVLIIPLAMNWYETHDHLTPERIGTLHQALFTYIRQEQDWRGYISHKGWAHAAAHSADALSALGTSSLIRTEHLVAIVESIGYIAHVDTPLMHAEDDRLAMAAYLIMRTHDKTATGSVIGSWLASLRPDNPGKFVANSNTRHFLRSLYFRWHFDNPCSPWLFPIAEAVKRFDIFRIKSGF